MKKNILLALAIFFATCITAHADANYPSVGPGPAPAPITGTWTPALAFGGGTTGITYDGANTTGGYTVIGDVVVAYGRLVLTSKGSSTGVATLTGLPFTIANDNAHRGNGCFSTYYSAAAVTMVSAPLYNAVINTATVAMYQNGAGAAAALADTDFANTTTLRFTCVYAK